MEGAGQPLARSPSNDNREPIEMSRYKIFSNKNNQEHSVFQLFCNRDKSKVPARSHDLHCRVIVMRLNVFIGVTLASLLVSAATVKRQAVRDDGPPTKVLSSDAILESVGSRT